jgi:hypothetical protein
MTCSFAKKPLPVVCKASAAGDFVAEMAELLRAKRPAWSRKKRLR